MNAKYIAIFWVALIGGSYYIYQNFEAEKLPTIESIRNQTQEARIRAEEAEKNRLAAEDKLSQALYDSCYSQAITLTGVAFDEKQRRTYECWREELTKTNWTGKLAPASEPPSRPITSNSTKNVGNKSTVWNNQTGSQGTRSEVQPTGKTQGKWLGTSVQSGSKIPRTETVNQNGKAVQKWKEANYWLAYETAIKLIRKWEWYAPISKWDAKQCSGGYGHKAPCGMKVSKQQADKWLADDTHSWLSQVVKDFPNLSPEAQGALASFRHNCPAWYASVSKNGLKYFNSWCKISRDNDGNILPEYTRWLTNRRAEESKIIFSK